jgi:competence protein ComEC
MLEEKVELFNTKKDFFYFLSILTFILFYSLLIEFNNYKIFTRFDTQELNVKVLKHYTKISSYNERIIQILKLKSDNITFYTKVKRSLKVKVGDILTLQIWSGKITFYEYLTRFYTYSRVKNINETLSSKQKLNTLIQNQHKNNDISFLYQALFTATQLPKNLQGIFSQLGVSHLLAISGFHLGVLSTLLFFLLRPIYIIFQNLYFPYRNSKIDLFSFIAIILFFYLTFLDFPPSLLRAFTMLIIGFILHDRGFKIISMQTLFLTMVILIAFFPRLAFSIGFYLSIFGVFYIFLFLLHYEKLSKIWQFLLLPIWVYFMMLPFSLYIFSSFSIYHPLSILWTSLFTLFYPVSIFLHLISQGDLLDTLVLRFIHLNNNLTSVSLSYSWVLIQLLLSLLATIRKIFIYPLLLLVGMVFLFALIQVI